MNKEQLNMFNQISVMLDNMVTQDITVHANYRFTKQLFNKLISLDFNEHVVVQVVSNMKVDLFSDMEDKYIEVLVTKFTTVLVALFESYRNDYSEYIAQKFLINQSSMFSLTLN